MTMQIIDADKLIEFIDLGIMHSSINSMISFEYPCQ